MAETILAQIVFRLSTSAEWAADNPVLDQAEPGYDTTTGGLKIGDGVSTWADLEYISFDQTALNALLVQVNAAADRAEEAAEDAEAAAQPSDALIAGFINDNTPPASDTRTALNALFALASHTHTSAQITDWNTAILAALQAILVEGSNVDISQAGSTLVISATGGTGGLDAEATMDYLGGVTAPAEGLKGTGLVSVAYNDAAHTLTVTTTATANSTDAFLLNRANQTGTVPAGATLSQVLPPVSAVEGDTIRRRSGLWVREAFPDLTGYATKSAAGGGLNGSIRQFADVADTAFTDGVALIYDVGSGAFLPVDISTLYAAADPSNGRLVPAAYGVNQRDIVVVNPGEDPPSNMVPGTIGFTRLATATLDPTLLDTADARAQNNVVFTLPESLAVGDYVGLSLGWSGEITPAALDHFTAAYGGTGAGAGAFDFGTLSEPNTTAATLDAIAKITTAASAGSTVTVTARDAAAAAINRAHLIGVLYRLPGLVATSARDQQGIGGGSSVSNLNAILVNGSGATAQPNEVGVASAFWSSLVAPADRGPLVGTNGWIEIDQIKSDNGASARTLYVGYKILNSIQNPPGFTSTLTSSDGQTGAWAAHMATYKAA